MLAAERLWHVEAGDCLTVLRALPDCSIDACVTDPPYGIGFMGHEWDQPGRWAAVTANGNPEDFNASRARARKQHKVEAGAGHPRERARAKFGGPSGKDNTTHTERGGAMHAGRYDLSPTANRIFQEWCATWATEVLRVLKPGGHLVVFGGTRTYHRMVCGIEEAGFEIRDQLAWLFGQGFPKSRNVGEGRGTALKPAHEPIALARKRFSGPVDRNVAEHGTGALNIDDARLDANGESLGGGGATTPRGEGWARPFHSDPDAIERHRGRSAEKVAHAERLGRWPANVALDEEAAAMLDAQSGDRPSGSAHVLRRGATTGKGMGFQSSSPEHVLDATYGDTGGASRFMFVAKPSKAERNVGLDRPNPHPTVKPVALMQWLVRLVTPKGGIVLDPFTGSGTTGMAAMREARRCIGIERDAEYVEVARARIIGDAPLLNGAHA